MEMEGVEDVGCYASFVARVGRASSEMREMEGTTGDSFMTEGGGRGNNILDSSSDDDENMLDETTFIVAPGQSENLDNEQTLLADKTTLVIPPNEIQGFLRGMGVNSRKRRTGIKVKKDENGQFLCPICNRPFNHRGSAFHHSYTHMNQLELEKVNIYHQKCPHSPQKIFFTRQHYASHMNSHLGIKNFKCQICQKEFVQKANLHRHILAHVNQGSQEVQYPWRHIPCYFCHKKFADMSKLIRHLVVHTKETPFQCSYCNKWFTEKSGMSYHILQFHSHNPQPFPCPHCQKNFNGKPPLTKHIKNVHGEKLHKCSDCPISFSTKRNLDVHVDAVHRKIRHQCPQCPNSYSTKGSMIAHMKKEH